MKKTILALLLSVLMITTVFAVDYTIELVDSYGDGWNGGVVTVNVNGTAVLTALTIEDGSGPDSYTFAVQPEDLIEADYTAGSWATENEYQIKNELGVVVAESGQGGATPGDVSYTVPVAGTPSIPTLTTPANGASDLAIIETLEWTTGDNTDHSVLYFADNVELTGATVVDPATSPYSPTMAYNTTYYWKVVAVSGTSLTAETAVWSFTTELDPATPDAPGLTTPANGATNVALDATLEWTSGTNTDHDVLYFADNAELTGATVVNPATSPYSPTMDLNTTYYWKVVAVGTTGIEVESAVRSYTTEYGVATVPYSENFDTATNLGQPAGWIPLNNSNSTYANAYVYNTNSFTSPNSYRLYNSSASTGSLIASTPKLENAGNRVRFNAKAGGTGYPLLVGTMTDAMDDATFVALDTLALTTTHTAYIIDLPADRSVNHVSFKHGFGGTYRYIYIDDVNVEEIPTSAIMEFSPEEVDFGGILFQDTTATPITVTLTNVGGVSAQITEASVLNTSYFTLTDVNEYPVTLEPQASITVDVTPLTALMGIHTSTLRFKQTDPGDPFNPINLDAALSVEILDNTGDDHNVPFVLTLADQIITEHSTTPYNVSYDFCSSQSVVYKLTLPTSKLMDISLEGTLWDTKLYVFNSFDQIDTATQSGDAWYYNDDESSAGTGGRFIEETKTRDRAVWSKMNQSFAPAGDYYIIVTGYSLNNGDFGMTINTENIPAPAAASNPFPADEAENQPTNLTLTWDNSNYTETVDIYFGNAGSMQLVEEDIPAVEEYALTDLETARQYEWAIVNRNYAGETVDTLVATWSFSTTGEAPVAATYTSPADEATAIALSGNLIWGAVTGADGYKVYFSEDNTFAGVIPVEQTATSYAYSGDYNTTYYWKVIPYNVVGEPTEGIETWSFTTDLSPFPTADLVFDGVRSVNHGMPMEPYYGYTITQNIYHQEELNVDDSAITSISYLYNKNSAWSETVEIYMKHTSKDTFADGYDWELDGFTHVYSGTMNVTTSEAIVTFDFNTPFVYNNTDNLVVLFFATQSGFHGSSDEFYNYPVAGNRSLTQRSDSANYYTTFPGSIPSGSLKAYRPVSGFTFEEVSLDPVFAVSADTLNFVDQIMGTESGAQALTISNLGLATLGINSLALTGTNADQFILTDTNTYPASLEISENITVLVVYAPNTEGDHTAQLDITDDQGRTVNTVYIVGNSIDTNIYATDLPWNESFEGDLFGWYTIIESTNEYANITLNTTTSNVQDGASAISFYNSGDAAASLQLIAPNLVPDMDGYRLRFWMKGTAGAQMILAKYDTDLTTLTAVDTFAVPLTYGQTVVEFEAARANERFVFLPAFSGTYQYVYLDNVIFEETPLLPVAELNVEAIEFGEVEVGTTTLAETVTITNVGPGTLTINNVEITGTDASLFAMEYVEETPDMALENGETLELTVTFSPDAVGLKEATLVITDDLGSRIRINSASKSTNNTRNANNVALTGTGWVPPQGSTCSDPLFLTLPAVGVTGTTDGFVDDYEYNFISPTSYYLGGNDIAYQFTLAQGALINGTITTTNTYPGAFIVQDEPNVTTPAAVIVSKTSSSNTLTYTNSFLPAGTYYLIISSYAYYNQFIDFTINLTADPLPIPGVATSPSPADEAIDRPTSLTLAWTNANYTETIDLWLGVEGGRTMTKVLDDVAAVNSYQATNLTPNATYNWKVINRNYSGVAADTLVSTWSFTTIGTAPAAVTYTSPTNESTNRPLSGSLTWTAATGASGYNVYLSTDDTFATTTPVDQPGTSYAYSGLDYETTYYWKVLPYNVVGEPTEGVLVWSFTTIPDPTIPMPVTIDFEGTTSNPAAITLENFTIGTNQHGAVGNIMYKNVYSATTNGYIQFQSMNNIPASAVISFDYRLTNWSAGTVGITSVEGHDYLNIYASTDNGANFVPVDAVNGTDHVDSAEFATFTADISAYAGQSVIFRFEMNDDTVNDYWFDIDNIYFGEPLISELDVPVVTMATANGIAVEWQVVENAVSYMVYAADTPNAPEESWELMTTTTDMYYLHTGDEPMKFFKVMATTEAAGGPAKRFGRRN